MEDSLPIKQVEVLLDIQTKKLQQEISSLREELSRTKEELLQKFKEVRVQEASPVPSATEQFAAASPPQPEPEGPRGMTATEAAVAPVEAPAATEPVDRNGVDPADVSIEKIFYTGSN